MHHSFSTQEDYYPKQGANLTAAPINGNDFSPPETEAETEAEAEVESPEGGDGCHCEWKDLLSTVAELKRTRRRLSEQNGSLLRSVAQSEDTNLQLTVELAQLRAKLASAQRTAVRARSLSEELDEARQALKESKERSARAQASSCTLNEKLTHEKTCSEGYVSKLMRVNAEIRKELDERLASLAEKASKETTFIDELKISHLENLRIFEGMQLELMRLQDNSRQELLRFGRCTVDPQSPLRGCGPVPRNPSLQSEIQETEEGGNMEGANNPMCGILPQHSQRDNFQQILHQIQPLEFVPLFHRDRDAVMSVCRNPLRERELEVQKALREEVEGRLEEACRQTQEAKRMAVINWWRVLKVERDRTKVREEVSQASRSREEAEERLQRAEVTLWELRDQVHRLQTELRTASQQSGDTEGKEAAFPRVDASQSSEEQRDVGATATDPTEEADGWVACGGSDRGEDSTEMAHLLHLSEGRLRQAREREVAATERVERTLSGAADAMAHLGKVEAKRPNEPTAPSSSADLGSVGVTSSMPSSTERCWSPTGQESVSQSFQVPQGHLPKGGIISPGTGGGKNCAEVEISQPEEYRNTLCHGRAGVPHTLTRASGSQDINSPGAASLTDTPTPAPAPLSTSDSPPNILNDDSTGSVSESVRTQTAPLESGAHHVAPISGAPHPATRPDPICGNVPESHAPEHAEGSLTNLICEVPAHSDCRQSEPADHGRSQVQLIENPTPIDSEKAEEDQTPACATLRACDWPPEIGITTASPAPPSPTKGTPLCPRTRPPLVPAMPSLPEEEEDSPEDLDSASSSPVTCTPVGNKVVTMAFPAPSIVFPSQDDPGNREPKPLEQARPHSPRTWLSQKSTSSSGGTITTFDSAGHVIDLVKDQLPDLQLSVEDKQKNMELLEEAKRVSDRFLSRRGRRSTSSLSESPTGSLSPNLTPYGSPAPSRSSSLTVPPQTAGLSSICTPHSSPVPSRSNSLSVPCRNAPEELGVNYVSPAANQCLEVCVSGEQEDTGPQDQEGLRKLVDWKPSEKRKVSSGTLSPRHGTPATAREGSVAQWESCEPRPGREMGRAGPDAAEGPGQGGQRKALNDEAPATGAATPVPRSASQQAPCTAEIRTMGAFPPLMRAVSWDTVGSFPARDGLQGTSPKNEEALSFFDRSSEALLKSSGYKDFPVQPVNMQKLTKMREENKLIRNQSIVGSKLPDLSESAEQDRGPSPCPPPTSPEDEAKEKSDVMPNISDIMLRKLKLHRALPGSVPPLTEKEVENAFVQLSLAFRNDNYTLEMRMRQAERERNMTEENTEKELEEFKGFLKGSVTLWQTSEQRDSYQRLLETVAVLHRLATRLSSRAEMVGAVRQEKRMNKATEVMMQYVENLKRTYEKDHAELMEFKKLANQNSNRCYGGSMDTGDDGVPRTSRSMSVTLGKALPRRRVSVAVVPKFNLLNIPGQSPPNAAASPLVPVLCEANSTKASPPMDPAQHTAAESGKALAEQDCEISSPVKALCGPPEISSEAKAKIEEDAYNKGYQEGLKKSKELQELKEAEEKMEESRQEVEEEKERERETNEAKEKKHSSRHEKVLDVIERLCPKLFRQHRLLWLVLALFTVTFLLVGIFTYFEDCHGALGDVPTGKAMGPGKKKFFGWNGNYFAVISTKSVWTRSSLAIVTPPVECRRIKVYTMPVVGVFEVAFQPYPNQMIYGFNATQAREVCQLLNVTIASKAQVEEAHRSGLETCRFGWIDEQIAVIPRIKPSTTCGQNLVGVIPWRASVTKLFDVFCFNSSGLQIELDSVATSVVPVTTKKVSGISSSSPPTMATRLLLATWQALPTSLPLSTSPAHPNQPVHPQPMSSTESSFGVVPTALLVTAVTLLLLAAVTALWRNKTTKNSILFWKRDPKKKGSDTEVWKSTCEKELSKAESEEEGGRNNSNIGPSVDPEAQAESA
ncbi:hypothetical protein AAFF_G00301870 [Aldrovandia affinis]|uniref:Link domain-containing protein n=1 Tax=Aldrovandia affinis TaxID=143900 RepID=A0AAD7SQ78_9TELE|nr:hypothetical protein AAFF_G00301870 [Aldrovandia affinis]